MLRQRYWKNGILYKELLDGKEITDNLGILKPVPPLHPIHIEDWPLWAKGLAMMSKPEDKGIGDVVSRIIGNENSEKFKAWHLATFGKVCGCNGRQKLWNMKYPINSKAT